MHLQPAPAALLDGSNGGRQYLGRQTPQRKAKTKDPCLAICTTLKFVQIVVSVTRAAVSLNNQKICAICSLVSCNRHHRDINLSHTYGYGKLSPITSLSSCRITIIGEYCL